ncbi:MAG: RNase adapter RapZ [Rhodospirillaceae bacterium]|nr:RNase adapter RapZ [Rhodospirillaceae bacterium]HAA91022.1 RNase adapter RapZ [Rhodospirillaceae bacterium]
MNERVVLVTGMSGAGRTATLKGLEDLGYEAVDNLPLSMLGRLVDQPEPENLLGEGRPLAIGVDLRTRDFTVDLVIDEIERWKTEHGANVFSVFVDCEDSVLVRRYTETRRRHPLAPDRPLPDTIKLERRLLSRLRDRADLVIDTTERRPAELKEVLAQHFSLDRGPGTDIFVTSFSFRHGLPREADLVFDVRFLRNPHYEEKLRPLTGEDLSVQSYIAEDPEMAAYLESIKTMLGLCLPRYRQEGKSYLTIAVGCTGGRHRSVFTAIELANWLETENWPVSLRHRDINRDAGGDML